MSLGRLMHMLAVCCALVPAQGLQASPASDLSKSAKQQAKELRQQGWPESRCYLSATFQNQYVAESYGTLKEGDRLTSIDGTDVTNASNDRILEVLREIDPTALIPIQIERNGEPIEVAVQCADIKSLHTLVLNGLDLAGRKKFDECANLLSPFAEKESWTASIAYDCAIVADNQLSQKKANLAFAAIKGQIKLAKYDPNLRQQAATFLRKNRTILDKSRFNELLDLTTEWEGDETLYNESEPNWFQYRVNAERAVVSSFFDPSSAQFSWPNGFTYGTWKPVLQKTYEGYWTCGSVNGKNRFGGYVGNRAFVVVMGHNAEVLYYEVGSGESLDFVLAGCQNGAKFLPPAPNEFWDNPEKPSFASVPASTKPIVSVADELKKLADLFNSGALTQEEYDAAKAQVLSPD